MVVNKFKNFCSECHMTVFIGEGYVDNKRVTHRNCSEALSDLSIKRQIDPRLDQMISYSSKKKLKRKLKQHVI